MKPSIGRIVHYRLTAAQAEQMNRRRTNSTSISDRIKQEKWPLGAQAHIGNPVNEGDIAPMLVVRIFPDEFGSGIDGVNGQVFMDGNDTLWVTSVREGDMAGEWNWPPRIEVASAAS